MQQCSALGFGSGLACWNTAGSLSTQQQGVTFPVCGRQNRGHRRHLLIEHVKIGIRAKGRLLP